MPTAAEEDVGLSTLGATPVTRIRPAGLYYPTDGSRCAVTLATIRGPAFSQAAVKLFQAACKRKEINLKSTLKQLIDENAGDFAVSLLNSGITALLLKVCAVSKYLH